MGSLTKELWMLTQLKKKVDMYFFNSTFTTEKGIASYIGVEDHAGKEVVHFFSSCWRSILCRI